VFGNDPLTKQQSYAAQMRGRAAWLDLTSAVVVRALTAF